MLDKSVKIWYNNNSERKGCKISHSLSDKQSKRKLKNKRHLNLVLRACVLFIGHLLGYNKYSKRKGGFKMFKVMMIVDGKAYAYGTYNNYDTAVRVALEVSYERNVQTFID